MIHRLTGEHANVLELVLGKGDGSSGTGRGINFNWRISVDSGIPRQQWTFGVQRARSRSLPSPPDPIPPPVQAGPSGRPFPWMREGTA
jgi:hypothetical protein